VWDTATGRETLSIKSEGGFYHVDFDRSGERIAAAGNFYLVSLYETESRGQAPRARLVLGEPYRPSVKFKEKMRMPDPLAAPAENHFLVAQTLEAETLVASTQPKGVVITQLNMADFGPQWSKGKQLLWQRAGKGDVFKLILPVEREDVYEISVGLTLAPDYGVINLAVDGQWIKGPLDLYSPKVSHSGELSCGRIKLKHGENFLEINILDKNKKSSDYLVGFDWIKLAPFRASDPTK
jgi:hypothetical protein